MFVTWRDIQTSLNNVDDDRLDDIAQIEIDGELVPFDVLEVDVPEIDDQRLVAYPQT